MFAIDSIYTSILLPHNMKYCKTKNKTIHQGSLLHGWSFMSNQCFMCTVIIRTTEVFHSEYIISNKHFVNWHVCVPTRADGWLLIFICYQECHENMLKKKNDAYRLSSGHLRKSNYHLNPSKLIEIILWWFLVLSVLDNNISKVGKHPKNGKL